jgi:hypothetical protein
MRFFKSILFFLIVVALLIGLTVPVDAGQNHQRQNRILHVKGNWELPISNGTWLFEDDGGAMTTAREGFYEMPDGSIGFSDTVGIAKYTGDLEGYHMMIYTTYSYPESGDEKWVALVKTRLHVTINKEEMQGIDIDAWGNQTLEIWHPQVDESGAMPMTGSGKYSRPFNPRFCSPMVFLKYDGWMNEGVEGSPPTGGTYEGVIINRCK